LAYWGVNFRLAKPAHRGLPFELQVINEKTMKVIENSRQGKGKTFSSAEDLSDDLGI